MKLKSEYKRAIVLLVAVIFVELWVILNSGQWFSGALNYVIMGVLGVAFYTFWDKF